ncbi:DUF1456 family protein [Flavobacterium silvaticum]|uniref:DUF1456 family protein n=1 Tax=Flavobacterium silvaticum TaxID=1852020 RepID=A0A972FKW8_9FLAO|nr:DUF1456 family protein [Flavobacterium silvaticum]NMH27909.1 DUF1456 family protein [Flavobacterium silvaticum]
MNNNDIFKKLRVALQLRDDQIVEIMELVDFRMSKGEIGNMFRNADHPNFMECGDQVLRNFLNGLVIHLRGTKENPKNPREVIAANAASVKAQPKLPKSDDAPKRPAKPAGSKPAASSAKPSAKKPFKKFNDKPKSPVENVKFTIKKKK